MMKTIFLLMFIIGQSQANEISSNPTILYIGDSHSYGKFGSVIEQNLSKISDRVIMESSCGSSASTWLGKSGYQKTVCGFWKKDGKDETRSVEHQTPRFSDELINYRPEVSIIQLGTNMAANINPKNSSKSIDELMVVAKNANSLCIWIGPPDANNKIVTKEKLAITNQMIQDLAKKNNCYFINSLAITEFPKDDKEGIHYPPSLSKAWGEKVGKQILEILNLVELKK